MTQCLVAVRNIAIGCRHSEVAADNVMFIRSQQLAQCQLQNSGIHKTKVVSSNPHVNRIQSKTMLFYVLNKFKPIGSKFEITANPN
jgi:hypothetical protein